MKKPYLRGFQTAALVALGGLLGFIAASEFRSLWTDEPIHPGPGLTRETRLSAYVPGLAGTPGDTDVFIFDGGGPGANILIAGGTHPNEPAGFVSAVVVVENIRVLSGKVVVVPRANASGFTANDPQEAVPARFTIKSATGDRTFRLGSRLTNPVHQWPDPTLYQNPAGQMLAASEVRNLNRCYPGRETGYLTEKVAFGIMELIRQEEIDLAVDLHESAPEYPVINALVFHEGSAEIAALAQIALQEEGLDLRLEASPPNLRGLSHREWGDAAGIKAILVETPNPVQGRLKGRTTEALVVDGRDKDYLKAARLGRLFVPYDESGIPMSVRVARHLAAVQAILTAYAETEPEKVVDIAGFPDWKRIQADGVGAFLR